MKEVKRFRPKKPHPTNNEESWTSNIELDALKEWSKGVKLAAEVGTWKGRSAEALVSGMNIEGRLYCVDSFIGDPQESIKKRWFDVPIAEVRAAWMERMSAWEERAWLLEKDSVDAAEYLKQQHGLESLDLVFIDACHQQQWVERDLAAWAPLVKEGGLLCGHDYDEVGVFRAVRQRFGTSVIVGPEKLWRVWL